MLLGGKEKENSLLEHYKMAVDASTILSITDSNGIIKYANEQFCKISGYEAEELIGKSHNIVRHPDMSKEAFRELWSTIKSKKPWRGIVKNLAKDGRSYTVEATIIPVLDDSGEIAEFVGIRHDITAQLQSKQELEQCLLSSNDTISRLKKIDAVTGLGNQNDLIEYLDVHKGGYFAIIGIKIDHLKSIKDVLGWEFSDQYIVELTMMLARYTEHVPHFKGLYRIYFDELVILFEGNEDSYEKLANEFSHLSKYFFVTHKDISVSSPFTIALFGDREDVYAKTLSVLLYAFENHRGEVYIGSKQSDCLEDKFPSNIYWLTKYSSAIENDEMVPFYQPILNNKTDTVEKFECLARIQSIDDIVQPHRFISLAMSARQITFLTRAIVRKSFEYFADKPKFEFSINVSAMDLQDEELLKQILYWQNKAAIDPSRVIIEILESEDIYKYKIFKKAIEGFKSEGFKIAIDDFGTGYSNFIALYEYNVDFIKIDGSFIKTLDTDPSMYELVTHLDQLIKMCGAKSVAEFVSNEKILSIVKQIGIDYSQGYYIGQPAPDVNRFL